jgi:2-aminoethylphosphonate-pyruvate transaminase
MVEGTSLLARNLRALRRAGLDDVEVLVDSRALHQYQPVERHADLTGRVRWWGVEAGTDAAGDGTHRDGSIGAGRALRQWWTRKGRAWAAQTPGSFLVVLADRLISPTIFESLADTERRPGESILAVDGDTHRLFDVQRATKVRQIGPFLSEIDEALPDYEAVFTGVGVASAELLECLATRWSERSAATRSATGDISPSSHESSPHEGLWSALHDLARRTLVRCHDVSGQLWHQVSSPDSRAHAQWLLRAYGDELVRPAPARSDRACATAPTRGIRPPGGDPRRTLSYIDGLLSEKNARHYVLLNPGPVNTSPRVKSALVHHDVCHRDSDYSEVVRRLERKLRRVFLAGQEHAILLITGSGTAAMEAAVSSVVPVGKKLLVIANGAFGERFAEVARLHQIDTVVLTYPWGELPDPEDVSRRLAADPDIFAVAMVHHETSVGLLNPVSEVGARVRAYDRLFIVDSVASLGGEQLDVTADNIDICFSSSNKCIHAPCGISFLCVHERVWKRIEQVKPRVYYLDLKRYRQTAELHAQTPFTPAVSTSYALDVALDELLAEGVGHRIANYRRRNARIRAVLRSLGITFFTTTGRESSTITCAKVPAGVRFDDLYSALKARGYIIYDGKEALRGRYFQIANMGEISDEMIEEFLAAFTETLNGLRRVGATIVDDRARAQA